MKYREKIIELYRNPPNAGKLDTGRTGEGENPSCGDRAKIYLGLEGSQIIDARHESSSCVIATAVIDRLCEHLKGKTVDEALSIQPSQIQEDLGFSPGPGREKCVRLPFETLENALEDLKDEN